MEETNQAEGSASPSLVQPTIAAIQERRAFYDNNSDVAKQTDRSIKDLIIVDTLPYIIVDGEAFQNLNFSILLIATV